MEMPPQVMKTFESLRKERGSISAKLINGSYYVYEFAYKRDRELGKLKEYSLYIGKIENDGIFVEAKHRLAKTSVQNAEQYARNVENEEKKNMPISETELSILQLLSMDSALTYSSIAERLDLSLSKTIYAVKKLEKEYRIKYTLELRPETFGFSRYMIMAKFGSRLPEFDKLKRLMEENPIVQYAVLAEGDYNLIIYVLAESNSKLEDFIYSIRSNPIFKTAPGMWYVSYLIEPYGWYIPFRDEFFDMLKERVWHRTKEQPRREKGQFLETEYAALKELNANARKEFSSIEKKYGLSAGSVDYAYHKLVTNGTIKRATITMGNPNATFTVFIYLKQWNINLFNEARVKYLQSIIEETYNPSNKFIYVADSSSPYGITLIAHIYDNGELENIIKYFQKDVKGLKVKKAIITSALVGSLGTRKFDMKESDSYSLIKELEHKSKNIS